MFIFIYCLLNDKKSAQKVWSKDLVYKGTFRLSRRTPIYKLIVLLFKTQRRKINVLTFNENNIVYTFHAFEKKKIKRTLF